jgi:lysosomal alpha-glucosidase
MPWVNCLLLIAKTTTNYIFYTDIILQPAPAITFRAIGGILDFYVFLGPTPGEVVSQYTEVIGLPYLPPYWGLGYHQCRFGYKTLNRTKEILQKTIDAGIPIVILEVVL